MMPTLFDPLTLGDITIRNRVVMSPLTRSRSGVSRVPNDMMVEYYTQRASMGLIITEATAISPMAVGYADTPGIWSTEQIEGWRKITDAVHAKDGKIILQLWHVGRISDPLFLDGALPVAPSAIAPKGHVSLVRPEKPYVTPHALDTNEIAQIVTDYRRAAENAKQAGFDGVEIHGANGYLIDQFLQDSSNTRTDQYGGSIENRARFLLEVTDAVISVWGAGRVGMHLAPRCDAHDVGDSDPVALFSYVAEQLKQRKIAFICAREPYDDNAIGPKLKNIFGGVYIANQQFTAETAQAALDNGTADAVAFGVLAIANPDLVARFQENAQLNTPDKHTFYHGGENGYTDYPFYDAPQKAKAS
jgi:2,4-dienoyl-CoA reductase-like NADH-dependent reductase (Old Yellow Enzyme family)